MSGRRVAAIDFGTNTARLLVADLHADGGFEQVRIEREIVRMGGGFSRETGLSDDAMQRGSLCLGRFARILQEYDVTETRAVATSAVRDAGNGRAFVERIYRQTGIALNVIDGEQEGALTLAGVMAGLDCRPEQLMVFDVGGGSTEYTLAHAGRAAFIRSLPLGVVRLTEGKVSPDEMCAKIDKELELLVREMDRSQVAAPDGDTLLVGTAGTATTLAAISLRMASYDYRLVQNSVLGIEEVRRIYALLLPLSLEERVGVPGLERGREDLIIAGILITLHTMERFGFTTFKVSDYGLLEGLIVADGVPSP
jgi:exopolyphosphatase / guanosine-5'-triphosphate,3'-diphosphate pyrophosphatase